MATRDKARSDLYLAQLRSQSAPNTPGGPLSPRSGGWRPPVDYYAQAPDVEDAFNHVDGNGVQYASLDAKMGGSTAPPKPFQLQAPPIRIQGATPKMQQNGFESQPTQPALQEHNVSPPVSPMLPPAENVNEHMPAAPGEQQYDSVPIPGAYTSPSSPGAAPQHMAFPPPGRAS